MLASRLSGIFVASLSCLKTACHARVEYELWTSPTDQAAWPFLRSWKNLAVQFRTQAFFNVHMYVLDGVREGCQDSLGRNTCLDLCSNAGRYCAADDLFYYISGFEVLRESLRWLCIWEHYGAAGGVGEEWWEYVTLFLDRCYRDAFSSATCILDSYEEAGIDTDVIEACIVNSGPLEGNAINQKLQDQINNQNANMVTGVPTFRVNGTTVPLTETDIIRAICELLDQEREPPPEICDSMQRATPTAPNDTPQAQNAPSVQPVLPETTQRHESSSCLTFTTLWQLLLGTEFLLARRR